MLEVCPRTTCILCATGPTELFLADHQNNKENDPSVEVWPQISSG